MAKRGAWWTRMLAVPAALAGTAAAWLSVSPGGRPSGWDPDDEDGAYRYEDEEEEESALPPVVERAFDRLGIRGGRLHERAEQYYAMYRLLKALGLSDAEIATLVVQKGGERLDEELGRVRPSETRGLFEAVEETVVRAAAEVDARMDLGGDLVRRVRESAVAARVGREEALSGLERGLSQGREQLRRVLRGLAGDKAE